MKRRIVRKTKKDFQKMVLRGFEFIEERLKNRMGNGIFYMAELSGHIFQRTTTPKDDAYVRGTLLRHIKAKLDTAHGMTVTYLVESQHWIITEDGSNEIDRMASFVASVFKSKNTRQKITFIMNHKKRHQLMVRKILPLLDKARQDIDLIAK